MDDGSHWACVLLLGMAVGSWAVIVPAIFAFAWLITLVNRLVGLPA